MNRTKQITGLSLLVLAQVVLFVIVYLATIGLGVGLVYLAFHASIWIIPPFFENVAPEILRLGKLGVLLLVGIIIGIVGLWSFIVAIGVYLIKPLFIFPKQTKDYGLEIKREDSPKLYDMIMRTADEAGVRHPKHIYVNHEVNACVFFNTGFWNIFLPIQKNLSIGLGLFESTNVEEVKSVIAHEFGHFAQSSMRVGSVLYIANKVITDLAYRRDKLDSLMLRWCLQDGVWGFWGKATQSVVIKFRSLVEYMFRRQQRNYMKLSRQMEYDADAVACRIVGKEVFISALCKIQKLSRSFDFYNRVLSNFADQNQTVSDYWKGYEMTRPNMDVMDLKLTSFDRVESTPELESVRSRVSIEEIWESHPSIENRIKNAQSVSTHNNSNPKIQAWDLVSDKLKIEVSQNLLSQLKKSRNAISILDWANYTEILVKKVEMSFFPKEVEIFFDRDIVIDSETLPCDNPMTDENRTVVMEFEQAIRDKQLLSLLNSGKIPVKHFIYNGTDYTVDNVPVSDHDQYVDDLHNKVAEIDISIRKIAETKAKDSSLVTAAYDAIAYTQSIFTSIKTDFLPVREDMIKELNEAKIAGEEDFDILRGWLDSYETALKDLLKKLKYRQIVPFMTKEEHEHIIGYLDASRSFITGINNEAINHMFAVTDWILRVHNNLNHTAKTVVISIILNKDIPDVKFLELWTQTNPDISEDDESSSSDDKEHVIIDSAYGRLDLVVPTDEEIETIYYQEWFRCHMWEKYENLEREQRFDYSLVATVPFNEEEGRLSCSNPEDEEKFLVEMQEYYRFLETHIQEPDWSKISEAADNGSSHACSRMAELYLSQNRYNMAFEAAMKGALDGDSDGMVMLGILESSGKERHPELAVKLFKCASAGGNMHALCNLGLRYAKGEGVAQDEKKAIRLFERAAFQGNAFAQNNAGYMYLHGKGADTDPEKGLFWLYKAANHGYYVAVNTIWEYHKSVGDTDQYIKVVQWGAEHGLEECRAELDIINMLGTQSVNNVLNYDVVVNNPTPVYDTTIGQGLCPVCGKPVPPDTTTCPHCKELIWDNEN